MTKGEKGAQGSAGKFIKPTEPLFPKTPHQTDLSQKLSISSKLCFAIGGAPKEVAASATAFFLQIYLLDVAQINAFQASMVLFIGKAWGAVTDPIVGFFITKTRWTKIGRLMPWMVGCTPFGCRLLLPLVCPSFHQRQVHLVPRFLLPLPNPHHFSQERPAVIIQEGHDL
ncbi:major facilitator superfamily domain-containing protein 2B-like [Sphaeramia orbicularis]|uniref:major facilitator superfamily domain-containing protein 2B-like n=1 Tax=Sphaeramia orbicularis TaxID=375764 RepID=UPI00117EBEC5|nr:major facilitator superfamily domain-containing protein 2B-like [Sphaeramia orbicularis]